MQQCCLPPSWHRALLSAVSNTAVKVPRFGGDNILRNDVAKVIKQWESAAFLCQNIKAIDAKISDVKRVKGRMQSEEVWTVQACGQVHHYNVRMHEDERGETNFNVSFLK